MITKIIPDYLRDYIPKYLTMKSRLVPHPEARIYQDAIVITCTTNDGRFVTDILANLEEHSVMRSLITRWAEEDHDVMTILVMGDL